MWHIHTYTHTPLCCETQISGLFYVSKHAKREIAILTQHALILNIHETSWHFSCMPSHSRCTHAHTLSTLVHVREYVHKRTHRHTHTHRYTYIHLFNAINSVLWSGNAMFFEIFADFSTQHVVMCEYKRKLNEMTTIFNETSISML